MLLGKMANGLVCLFMVFCNCGCSPSLYKPMETEISPLAATNTATMRSVPATPTVQMDMVDPCVQQAKEQITVAFFEEKPVQILLSNGHPFRLEFGSNMSELFILTEEGLLSINLKDGQARCLRQGENFSSTSLTSDPTRARLVVNTTDGAIHLLDSETGEPVGNLQSRNVNSVPYGWNQISPDGSLMISSGSFTSIRLWNLAEGSLILETLGDHAAINADNSRIAISGKDFLQWVDVSSGEIRRTLVDEHTRAYQLIYLLFDRTGKYVYALSKFSEIHIWDTETGEIVKTLNQCQKCAELSYGWETETPRISLSGDGTRLVLSDPNGVIVWDTTTWAELLNRYDYWDEPVADASISKNGELLSVALEDGTIYILYL